MRRFWVICVAALALGACKDSDNDGTRDKNDCRPTDPTVHPDAPEVCDGIDNNCNGQIDEDVAIVAYWDRDADGFGDDEAVRRVCQMPPDGVDKGGDCDDLDPRVNPDATEICNEVDDNCDAIIDDGVLLTFYQDADDDGHGVPGATTEACFSPPGYAAIDDDCNDDEPLAWTDAPERCDEVDNDCDGEVDEEIDLIVQWEDRDGDGFGDPERPIIACGEGTAIADNPLDCDDGDPAINPDAAEVVGNSTDEDCDGYLDELGVFGNGPYASVEEALDDAGPGDVVQLDSGFHALSIDLTDYPGVILAGEGCGRTQVYGDGAGSVVTMADSTVENFTIAGGNGTDFPDSILEYPDGSPVTSLAVRYGGGILVQGDATVRKMCVTASSAANGGGIAVLEGTDVLIEDTEIRENVASDGGAGLWVGPDTVVTARRIDVRNNRATGGGEGAGIDVRGGELAVHASIIAGNEGANSGVAIAAGPYYGENRNLGDKTKKGGNEGLYVYRPGTASLHNVTIHGNRLRDDASDNQRKGIAIYARGTTIELENVVISGHDDVGTLFREGTVPSNGSLWAEDPDGGLVQTDPKTWADPKVPEYEDPDGVDGHVDATGAFFGLNEARDRPPEGSREDLGTWDNGRRMATPSYVLVDDDVPVAQWDFHLLPHSELIDAGIDDKVLDPDGTPADVGAYGGPDAAADASWPLTRDTDADGMLDAFELHYGLNLWFDDAAVDGDGDGDDNLAESERFTDPNVADTDLDGVDDPDDDRPFERWSHAPAAVAPVRVWGIPGEPISLDATGSGDPQGDSLDYSWALLEAPSTSTLTQVDDPSARVSSLTADVAGTYLVALTVSDGSGEDTVTVEVRVYDAVVVPDDAATIDEAIDEADAYSGVALRPGTYEGTFGTGVEDLVIFGLGATDEVILDGNGLGPVFTVGEEDEVVMARLTITGGVNIGGEPYGGGIVCSEADSVELYEVDVVRNVASVTAGGGMFCETDRLVIEDSRFIENQAPLGAGVRVLPSNISLELAVRRTAFVGNMGDDGGAISWGSDDGGNDEWEVELSNNAFLRNEATLGAALIAFDYSSYGDDPKDPVANVDLFHLGFAYNRSREEGDDTPFSQLVNLNEGRVNFVSSSFALNDSDDALIYVSDGTEDGNGDTKLHALRLSQGLDYFGDGFFDEQVDSDSQPSRVLDVPYTDAFGDQVLSLAPRLGTATIDAGFLQFADADGSPDDIGVCGGQHAPRLCKRFTMDGDGDGLSDGWEIYWGLDPTVNDAGADPDGDGRGNTYEHDNGLNPFSNDTDHDGRLDGAEVGDAGVDGVGDTPTVVAGYGYVVPAGTEAALNGGLSTDSSGDPVVGFEWVVTKVPAASAITTADLVGADEAIVRFTPDVPGQFTLELTVTDDDGATATGFTHLTSSSTLTVPGQYATIDEAIAVARNGDLIDVSAGSYTMNLRLVNKQLSMRGNGADATTITPTDFGNIARVEEGSKLVLEDLTLADGRDRYSGAVECRDSELEMRRVTLTGHLGDSGGALYLRSCTSTFEDVSITDSIADAQGGGAYVHGGELSWTRGRIARNRSAGSGGLFFTSSTNASIGNVVFDRNRSLNTVSASAIRAVSSSVVYTSHNTYVSNLGGDVLYASAGTDVTVLHSAFAGNEGCALFDQTTSSPYAMDARRNGFYLNECDADPVVFASGTHAVKADPRFVAWDPTTNGDTDDYRLRQDSPLIDKGFDTDPDGTPGDYGAYGGGFPADDFDRFYADVDGDGLADGWEIENGLVAAVDNAAGDEDGDGLTNLEEHDLGTDPNAIDTDQDGISDADEVANYEDPLDPFDHAPTVDAGDDLDGETVGVAVAINASVSVPAGPFPTLAWTLVEVPGRSALTTGDLTGADTLDVQFTPDTAGRFRLQLAATGGGGIVSTDTVDVRVDGDLLVPDDYATVGEAVEVAGDGAVITIAAGTYPTNVELARNVTLQGAGPDQTILDGQWLDPVIITSPVMTDVAVRDLTITRGLGSTGGGVRIADDLVATLDNVVIFDNIGVAGGGVYVDDGADVTISDSTLDRNSALDLGGALHSWFNSTVRLRRSVLADNLALNLGGGHYMRSGYVDYDNVLCVDNFADGGGCLYMTTSGGTYELFLHHVTAAHNIAANDGGDFFYGDLSGGTVVEMKNLIVSRHQGDSALKLNDNKGAPKELPLSYSLFDNSTSFDLPSGMAEPVVGMSIDRGDVTYVDVTDDLDWTNDDYHLSPKSLFGIDEGDPKSPDDTDGSRADMGAFGGPDGDWVP